MLMLKQRNTVDIMEKIFWNDAIVEAQKLIHEKKNQYEDDEYTIQILAELV